MIKDTEIGKSILIDISELGLGTKSPASMLFSSLMAGSLMDSRTSNQGASRVAVGETANLPPCGVDPSCEPGSHD